jgi:hypothetical protein
MSLPPKPERIVLVTGSRDWDDIKTIHAALEAQVKPDNEMVLVHGACDSGADKIAADYAYAHGWTVRAYPAQWRNAQGKYDKAAGPKRNKLMVNDSRPHAALAFRKNKSRGTTNCISELDKYRGTLVCRMNGPVQKYEE